MQIINEIGRHTMQGGSRRSGDLGRAAVVATPTWTRSSASRTTDVAARAKAKDHTTPAPLDMTNISVSLDDEFFEAYETKPPDHERAVRVYRKGGRQDADDRGAGFSVDRGRHAGEVLRNACTEVTSADDSTCATSARSCCRRFDDPPTSRRPWPTPCCS